MYLWANFGLRTKVESKSTFHKCVECQGYIELDSKEGVWVCSICGLIQHHGTVNITPEFVAAPVVEPAHLDKALQSDGTREVGINYWNDLEHWNMCTLKHSNKTLETLHLVIKRIDKTDHGRFSKDVKVAAALLYPGIKDCFVKEEVVRNVIQKGGTINEIFQNVPTGKFDCAICAAKCQTRKESQYHCQKKHIPLKKSRHNESH